MLAAFRRLPIVPVLLLGALYACAPAQPETAPMPTAAPSSAAAAATAIPSELQSASQGYVAAWNQKDPAAVGHFFADDIHGTVGERTIHGRAQLVSGWVSPSLTAVSNLRATVESVTPAGDRFTETGRFTYTATNPGQAPSTASGTFTHVWARQPDGSWKIVSLTIR